MRERQAGRDRQLFRRNVGEKIFQLLEQPGAPAKGRALLRAEPLLIPLEKAQGLQAQAVAGQVIDQLQPGLLVQFPDRLAPEVDVIALMAGEVDGQLPLVEQGQIIRQQLKQLKGLLLGLVQAVRANPLADLDLAAAFRTAFQVARAFPPALASPVVVLGLAIGFNIVRVELVKEVRALEALGADRPPVRELVERAGEGDVKGHFIPQELVELLMVSKGEVALRYLAAEGAEAELPGLDLRRLFNLLAPVKVLELPPQELLFFHN